MKKGEVLVTLHTGELDYFATFEKNFYDGTIIVKLQKRIDMKEGFLSGYLFNCSKDSVIKLNDLCNLAESNN